MAASAEDTNLLDVIQAESQMIHTETRLPLELEREIFEIAASQRPIRSFSGLINLMLVARRVHEWVIPFLYNVMMRSDSSTIHNYPPSYKQDGDNPPVLLYPRYAKYVQHLMMDYAHADEALEMLRCCSNAQNVAIWMITNRYDIFFSIMRSMHIRKLSIEVEKLATPPNFAMDHTAFPHLTHLEVYCMASSAWLDWEPLTLIPTLRHLAINEYHPGLVEQILKRSQGLRVLILVIGGESWWGEERYARLEEELNDERVVLVQDVHVRECLFQWEKGSRGQTDIWLMGEELRQNRIPLGKQYRQLAEGRNG